MVVRTQLEAFIPTFPHTPPTIPAPEGAEPAEEYDTGRDGPTATAVLPPLP